MVNPISSPGPLQPNLPTGAGAAGGKSDAGSDFAAMIKKQLQRVSEMQNDADEKVQQLLTGESQNITEVFTAARKADVAFSLLMELRNKLVDAYQELQNMRI